MRGNNSQLTNIVQMTWAASEVVWFGMLWTLALTLARVLLKQQILNHVVLWIRPSYAEGACPALSKLSDRYEVVAEWLSTSNLSTTHYAIKTSPVGNKERFSAAPS
jgi:hypothetical protein